MLPVEALLPPSCSALAVTSPSSAGLSASTPPPSEGELVIVIPRFEVSGCRMTVPLGAERAVWPAPAIRLSVSACSEMD